MSDSEQEDIISMEDLIQYEQEYEAMYLCMEDPESEEAKQYIESTEEPPRWVLRMLKKK